MFLCDIVNLMKKDKRTLLITSGIVLVGVLAYFIFFSTMGWKTTSFGGYSVSYPSDWSVQQVANRYCGQGPNYSCDPIGVIISAPSGFPLCPEEYDANNPCSLYLGERNMNFNNVAGSMFPFCKTIQYNPTGGTGSLDIVFCKGEGEAHVTRLNIIFNKAYLSIRKS
jgi:hypothetical protein